MNIHKIFSLLTLALLTINPTQGLAKCIKIQNRSPFVVVFTIPMAPIESAKELDQVPCQTVTFAPEKFLGDCSTITIPDNVHKIWINLPPQQLCPTGKQYAHITVALFCVEDPNPTYDLYIAANTRFNNWLAAFGCYGTVDTPKAITQFKHFFIKSLPGQPLKSSTFLCFPIGSRKNGATLDDAINEVTSFTQLVTAEYGHAHNLCS